MQAYTVISIIEGTAADKSFRIVRTKLIKYMVGDDGPFTYTVPPGEDSPAQIAAALNAAAAQIIAIHKGA